MHLVVMFHNIGGYHAARLRATQNLCKENGWSFTAIEVTDRTSSHPWGRGKDEIDFPLFTLLSAGTVSRVADQAVDARLAASLLPNCLNTLQPDVVVIPGWGTSVARTALAWCLKRRLPTVVMSESKEDDEKRYWWKELLKSWLYIRKYDAALVGGELHRQYLIRLGFPAERIFLGYDVVDNNYFSQQAAVARQNPVLARQQQPRIPQAPYFLAATRFIQRKNVLRLIEAFARYRQQVANDACPWDLVICGSGEEETVIRNLIQQYQLQACVHLPGFVTYRDIGAWYGLASAFIHPAIQEQWGLVVNEACAAGLPILCSSTVGAAHELVRNHENGWCFDPGSQEEIAQLLLKMYQCDPETRLQMGQSSQKIVDAFTPQRFAEGLFNAIHVVLRSKHSS